MIDLLKILPNLLKEDEFSKNISLVLNKYLNEISDTYDNLFLMKNLDKFDDSVLDEIAKDKSIVWYDSALDIEQKIRIIRSHRLVYRMLGSEKAVLQLIQDYFGSSGSIENWHEYGGTHHRFKITLNDLPHVESFLDFFYRFLDALTWVKSADTWLDGVTINRNVIKNMYLGGVVNSEKRTNIIIKPYSDKVLFNLYNGVAINKIKKIGVNIKVVTGEIQRPFFVGVLVNKVNFKEINFKNLDDFRAVNSNGIVVNKVKIRRCNIE